MSIKPDIFVGAQRLVNECAEIDGRMKFLLLLTLSAQIMAKLLWQPL